MGDVRSAFDEFVAAKDALPALESFETLKKQLGLGAYSFEEFKEHATPQLPYKHRTLLTTLGKKWERYASMRLVRPVETVVSGAGPCGIRAAVELALLGHKVTLIELREECSRHNILKTWQMTLDDLVSFGLASFVPGLKIHGHLHVGTREIQLCLLKAALIYGVRAFYGRGVCGILRPNDSEPGWRVWTLPMRNARAFLGSAESKEERAELALRPGEQDTSRLESTSKVDFIENADHSDPAITDTPAVSDALVYSFTSLIVAEGESSRLIRRLGFDRKVTRFNEAIGIVVNLDFSPAAKIKPSAAERKIDEFVVWRSSATWQATPLGPLSKQGIELENMEYMRGTETHFIAATTRLRHLASLGIIKSVQPSVKGSLAASNVDFERLRSHLARPLATAAGIAEDAPLLTKHGIQIFDFSCRGLCIDPLRFLTPASALIMPVGDALQNPYWPQGLGVNRGFHNAMDAAWVAHLKASGSSDQVVEEERRFSFKIMDWKIFSPQSLRPAVDWTADPMMRYSPELVKSIHMHDIQSKAEKSSIPLRYREAFALSL
ncbi:[F-actin]-monooxygenase mical3 [Quaeritorhiza haematococci]|nr:[F-actin]-monooxygenase mical3 [Quaeritorhiza haematococci]